MKKTLFTIAMLSSLLTTAQDFSGQLDPNFVSLGLPNAYPKDMDMTPDGKILVCFGGGFGAYRLNADGSTDATFTNIMGPIQAIVHPNGDYYTFGNQSKRITTTGAVVTTTPGMDFSGGGIVNTATMADGTNMFVAGNFTTAAWSANYTSTWNVPRIYKINENLDLVTSFNANIGTGFNANVRILKYDAASGKLYCGGDFTEYNGTTVNRICRLNADGTLDATFNVGTGADDLIYDIEILQDGRILIVGSFLNYNGVARNRSAILSSTGSLDATYSPVTTFISIIFTSLELPNGKLVLGTGYTGNQRMVVVNLNGTVVSNSEFNVVDNPNSSPDVMIQPAPGKLLIGGSITTCGTTTREKFAKFNICDQQMPLTTLTFDGTTITVDDSNATYQWYSENPVTEESVLLTGETNQSFSPSVNGLYYRCILKNGYCISYTNAILIQNLGLEEKMNATFTISPNPAKETVQISGLEVGNEISIVSLNGKLVQRVAATNSEMTINTINLENGVYFVRVQNGSASVSTQKLVVNK